MISVIIPTYNRADFLAKALQTVLMQKEVECEVIIIDDCSTDNTSDKVNAYKDSINITYIKNDITKGPGYSRLLGLKKSVGEYVVFMDDDDYYTDPFFYKKAISIFEKDQEKKLAFVSGNVQTLFLETGKKTFNKLNVEGHIDGLEYLLYFSGKYNKPKSTFSSVFSKKKLEDAGMYHMQMVNDSSIYMRALLGGSAYIMEDIIGVYVVHAQNISNHISDYFLIQNLEEKAAVKECLKEQLDKKQIRSWWANQVGGTVQYYVVGSQPSVSEFRHVFDWIKDNSDGYTSWKLRKVIATSYLMVIKNNIKKE